MKFKFANHCTILRQYTEDLYKLSQKQDHTVIYRTTYNTRCLGTSSSCYTTGPEHSPNHPHLLHRHFSPNPPSTHKHSLATRRTHSPSPYLGRPALPADTRTPPPDCHLIHPNQVISGAYDHPALPRIFMAHIAAGSTRPHITGFTSVWPTNPVDHQCHQNSFQRPAHTAA